MGFSENLRNIRREKNLSQEQLADLLNVSRQSVSKWEQDNGYPETEKLIQLAQKLDISLDALLLDRQSEAASVSAVPPNNAAVSGNMKITIQSFDGSTLAAFHKFIIHSVLFAGKNEPQCALCGVDKSKFGFLGLEDNSIILGWYATREDAQKELGEIHTAMQKGQSAYELKYNANVKKGMFNPKIITKNKE